VFCVDAHLRGSRPLVFPPSRDRDREVLGEVGEEARAAPGGMGYLRESEVERHHRDVRILGIGGSTNEILNEIIAKRLSL
jgi:alkylation response protein AidB-like acyl-CoA dehydrogenase